MLDVSVGCTNPNTYGVSCVYCGECGRKWTNHGVDDSEVVSKKVKQYKNMLESEEFNKIYVNLK